MSRNNPIFIRLFVLVVFLLALLAFVGCEGTAPLVMGSTHLQTRDSVRTEYKHDSIYIDRIHKEYIKGDTIRIHDSIYVAQFKEIEVHDSIYFHKTDSIPYPVEVEKLVPYKSGYTRFTSWFFWIVVIIAVSCGLWRIADYTPLAPYKKAIKGLFKLKKLF